MRVAVSLSVSLLGLAALLVPPAWGQWGATAIEGEGETVSTRVAAGAPVGGGHAAHLVDSLFEFRVLEASVPEEDAVEEMRTASVRFVELVTELLGPREVAARFEDLARNSPLAPGRIALVWIDGIHPHNIEVGVPYTGLAIGPVPSGPGTQGTAGVVVHELGHLFFGKFNDGLAEPIANMFRPDLFRNSPMQAVALALVRRIRAGEFRGTFDLETLMAYRPNAALDTCVYHRAGRGDAGSYVEARTLVSLAGLARSRGAELPADLRDRVDALDPSTLGPRRRPRLNPNETRGPVREAFATLGDALQHFLIQTRGVRAYLDFYYAPTAATLARLGIHGGYLGLEEALESWLLAEVAHLPAEIRPDAARGEAMLAGFLAASLPPGATGNPLDCLDPSRWLTAGCDSSRDYGERPGGDSREEPEGPSRRGRGPGSSASQGAATEGPGTAGSPGRGPPPPPKGWREQLAQLRVPRGHQEALPVAVSVTDALGTDLDLDRYCAPDHGSRPDSPDHPGPRP